MAHRSDVTVVLPCGDMTRYLGEAVASCLQQTEPPHQVIVVNDALDALASTEVEAVASMDPRVTVMRNSGSGLVDALNTGVEAVQTAFIARMDADDRCLPARFALQASHLRTHGSLVAVGGLVRYMAEDGALMPEIPWVRNGFPLTPDAVLVAMTSFNALFHPAALIRTQALRAVGGYSREYPHIEDYALWLNLLSLGDIENLDATVLHYRRHPAQVGEQMGDTQAEMVVRLHRDFDAQLASTEAAVPELRVMLAFDPEQADYVATVARSLTRRERRVTSLLLMPRGSLDQAPLRAIGLAASLRGGTARLGVATDLDPPIGSCQDVVVELGRTRGESPATLVDRIADALEGMPAHHRPKPWWRRMGGARSAADTRIHVVHQAGSATALSP